MDSPDTVLQYCPNCDKGPKSEASPAKRIASSIACSLFAAASLSAGIVNFAPLSQDGGGNTTLMSTYSQGGLTFSSSANDLFVWQRSSGDHPSGGDPATSLSSCYAASTLTFAATDNSPFSLYPIDLAQWGAGQGTAETTFDVDFVGVLHGGGTVTYTFSVFLSADPNLQHFTFSSGFTNLDSVSFVQGTFHEGTGIQFNNVNTSLDGAPRTDHVHSPSRRSAPRYPPPAQTRLANTGKGIPSIPTHPRHHTLTSHILSSCPNCFPRSSSRPKETL